MLPTATSPGEARRDTGRNAVQKNEILGRNGKRLSRREASWNIVDAKAADPDWPTEGFQLYQLQPQVKNTARVNERK